MGPDGLTAEDVEGIDPMLEYAVATLIRCPSCGHEGAITVPIDLADELIHGPMGLDLRCPACRLVFPFLSEPESDATPEDWI